MLRSFSCAWSFFFFWQKSVVVCLSVWFCLHSDSPHPLLSYAYVLIYVSFFGCYSKNFGCFLFLCHGHFLPLHLSKLVSEKSMSKASRTRRSKLAWNMHFVVHTTHTYTQNTRFWIIQIKKKDITYNYSYVPLFWSALMVWFGCMFLQLDTLLLNNDLLSIKTTCFFRTSVWDTSLNNKTHKTVFWLDFKGHEWNSKWK